MSQGNAQPQPPSGLSRLMYRLPIWLFRARLGWLLGKRFLLLNHTGRISGQQRQAVLEIAGHDRDAGTYLVASGWGAGSDWYRNLLQTPQVTIQVGNKLLEVVAEPLSPEQSGNEMVDYGRRYPAAARALTRLIGYQVDGTEESYRQLAQERIPFVRFRPN